ncbi:hypothetical protein [Phenylobacterium sp. J367]|uniref:hypothetical protein n=1 Tax=Phenylobacterium sp. J367 TaxID=2898435 RepID=UPI00215126E3|nr:hypothetical protein [Phenylobacterium sp. J367]MCR5880539.1 hypothetical protein [Phenylobacterium sp. J367]
MSAPSFSAAARRPGREVRGDHRAVAGGLQRGDHRQAHGSAADDQRHRGLVHPRLGHGVEADGEGLSHRRLVGRQAVRHLQEELLG